MGSRIRHKLTIAQVANGDNNNTASREAGMGPIIDANGWYRLPPTWERLDILLTASSVTSGFNVQTYIKREDGTEHKYGDPVSCTANGSYSIFQDDFTADAIKIKMEDRTDGQLDAEILVC